MRKLSLLLFLFLVIVSCSTENAPETDGSSNEVMITPNYVNFRGGLKTINLPASSFFKKRTDKAVNVRLYSVEYLTTGENNQAGNTVYFMDVGNKQLAGDFVPFISPDGTSDISYYIDSSRPSGNIAVEATNNAIDRAMDTWDAVTCSELGIFKIALNPEYEVGFIARVLQDDGLTSLELGGSYNYFADVVHAGWLPSEIYDILEEDGASFILAATFTIVFTDEEGNLVDIDGNGKFDVALREIYYNDGFDWNDGDTYDVETVALHESGHALSQAHFGKAFLSGGNERLHFSPRAVMNAAYSGVQTRITRTDEAGHCSNWASWPMR